MSDLAINQYNYRLNDAGNLDEIKISFATESSEQIHSPRSAGPKLE